MRTMRVMYNAKMLWRRHPLSSLVMPHVWSLVAVVRGRPCPNRARQREKWRERAGGLGLWHTERPSCRQSGGVLKPEVRLTLTVLGGFHAQLEPDRALVLPTKKA